MNGCNAFYIDQYNRKSKGYHLQQLLKGYKSWIGFSATISACGRELSNINFPQSIFLEIKKMNEKAGDNTLIYHANPIDNQDKFKKIQERVNQLVQISKNFIVILEDKYEVQDFLVTFQSPLGRKIFDLSNFAKFYESLRKIQSLLQTDFIVVTTREGGIGIDFKGTDVAHVIIAFEYNTYSELEQALGRGSRDINRRCTGSLIVQKKLPVTVEGLIELEKFEDQNKAYNIKLLDKVAKLLLNKHFNDDELVVAKEFQKRMRQGLPFQNDEDKMIKVGKKYLKNYKHILIMTTNTQLDLLKSLKMMTLLLSDIQ